MTPSFSLECASLQVNYDKACVLWDLSFSVPMGKLTAIVGPNGAGKSTLIKTALGFVRPSYGEVKILGNPCKKVRSKVAYVPQKESVDWDFPISCFELVLMGCYGRLGLFARPKKDDIAFAERMLSLVGLEKQRNKQISELSGGQQQRAFFARALMQKPEVLFLDEPFTGIDHGTELQLTELLKDFRDQGKSIFVVHHNLEKVREIFDWVVLLNTRLISAGSIEEAFTPESIELTYGKSYRLFNEAIERSKQVKSGIVDS